MAAVIRPATREDFARLGKVALKSARGLAVERDGMLLGIAGLYRDGPTSRKVLFSELTDELRRDKRALIALIRAVTPLMSGRVFSLADPEIEGSEVLLEHMGFEPYEGRVYQWHS